MKNIKIFLLNIVIFSACQAMDEEAMHQEDYKDYRSVVENRKNYEVIGDYFDANFESNPYLRAFKLCKSNKISLRECMCIIIICDSPRMLYGSSRRNFDKKENSITAQTNKWQFIY